MQLDQIGTRVQVVDSPTECCGFVALIVYACTLDPKNRDPLNGLVRFDGDGAIDRRVGIHQSGNALCRCFHLAGIASAAVAAQTVPGIHGQGVIFCECVETDGGDGYSLLDFVFAAQGVVGSEPSSATPMSM